MNDILLSLGETANFDRLVALVASTFGLIVLTLVIKEK